MQQTSPCQAINNLSGRCNRSQLAASAVPLMCLLVFMTLTGCSLNRRNNAPVETTPVVSEGVSLPPAEPTVEHFTDGREGFVITETSTMDAALRADFEQANVLLKEAKYAEAIALLEKVVEQAPGMTAPHINLALAYQQQDKADLAEQQLKSALELIPGHPLASNAYGLLLRKTGRFAEAREIYEKSLALFPEYSPLHKNLGILCDLYLHDLGCAVEQYEIYSKAVPKDEQAKLWVADLNARLGRQPAAPQP